jgi:hypothetical protein
VRELGCLRRMLVASEASEKILWIMLYFKRSVRDFLAYSRLWGRTTCKRGMGALASEGIQSRTRACVGAAKHFGL